MVRLNPAVIHVWTTAQMDNVQLTLAHCCLSASKFQPMPPPYALSAFVYLSNFTHKRFVTHCVYRCPVGWTGYRCEIAAASVDSSTSSGSKSQRSQHRFLLVKHALWFCSLMLFAVLQVLPPLSSQCFCCCYWHCWWLAPSCGISGECEGRSSFERLSIQTLASSAPHTYAL